MSKTEDRSKPLVSVIIPVYNGSRFIAQCLDSALSQTYRTLEVIVVDDGSTDNTRDIVESVAAHDSRVTYIQQSNRGVAAARNRGIRESEGVYIAPLDADDTWFMPKIEKQVARMRQGGSLVGLVYCWWLYMNYDGEIFRYAGRPRHEGDVFRAHVLRNFIGNGSVPLMRRTALEDVGLYDESFRTHRAEGCEDWDLTLRIASKYEFGLVPDHLSTYRRAENRDGVVGPSMSDNTKEMERSYWRVIAKVKAERPDLPDQLLRWSQANFYDYLAGVSYTNLAFKNTLLWLRKLVWVDPQSLLSSRIRRLGVKAFLLSMAQQYASTSSEELSGWKQIKSWIFTPYNEVRAERERRTEVT